MVKAFMTVAMGASSELSAINALCQQHGFTTKALKALTAATRKVFPRLELFTGWGLYAQNYEGQILKDVMLEGIKEGIVCLPVHDAVAVQQEHIEWAKAQMLASWDKITETKGLARVKVDLP
jgi:hypothetical protein